MHATVAHLFGFSSTLFQLWVNPDPAPATAGQRAIIAAAGPVFSLSAYTQNAMSHVPGTDQKQCDPMPALTPRRLVLPLAFLLAVDCGVVSIFWRTLSGDMAGFLIPWYRFIIEHGRFRALGLNFSDYSPPYLYLLSVASLAERFGCRPAGAIRGIAVAGTAVAGIMVASFARACGWRGKKAIIVAVTFFALPEMVVNGLVWGQCDAFYTLFLVAFVYFVTQGRGMVAAVMLGVAFAFKLQSIFIGPLIVYLLWVRRMLWRKLLLTPLTYLLLMVPAALAGRTWRDLTTIYFRQAGEYKLLSLNAPNPYLLIQRFLPGSYAVGVRAGLVVAVITALALVAIFVSRGRDFRPKSLVHMAALSLAVMPYVLPQMHERYFFPASAMAFLLAVVRPRTWPIVLMIQAADLCAYTRCLLNMSAFWVHRGFIVMTIAIGLLIWQFFDERDTPNHQYPLCHRKFGQCAC